MIHILNRYFETMGAIIDGHGGYIDKYMGDGLMVIFGLDRTMRSDYARQAVSAARGIVQALPGFNQYMRYADTLQPRVLDRRGHSFRNRDPGKPGFSQEEGIHRTW